MHPFIKQQLKNGKLYCTCGAYLPIAHPLYVIILEEEKHAICYPCSYKRTGFNPHQKAIEQAKEKAKQIEARREERIRLAKEKEESKKLKKQKKPKTNETQINLF